MSEWPPRFAADEPLFRERLNPAQAADLLGVKRETLRAWRHRGEGPPFYRVTRSTVWYLRADVVAWLSSRRIDHDEF